MNAKKKTIYVAGPMRNYEDFNFPAFYEAETKLIEEGYNVINPARNFGGRTDLPWHVYLGRAIYQIVTRVDAIHYLDGWWESQGAKIECIVGTAAGVDNILPQERGDDENKMIVTLAGIVAEAQEKVYGSRNKDYGSPVDDFQRQSDIASTMGIKIDSLQVALFMMAVKLSRECNRPKPDNLVDLAGYVMTFKWVEEETGRSKKVEDVEDDQLMLQFRSGGEK